MTLDPESADYYEQLAAKARTLSVPEIMHLLNREQEWDSWEQLHERLMQRLAERDAKIAELEMLLRNNQALREEVEDRHGDLLRKIDDLELQIRMGLE